MITTEDTVERAKEMAPLDAAFYIVCRAKFHLVEEPIITLMRLSSPDVSEDDRLTAVQRAHKLWDAYMSYDRVIYEGAYTREQEQKLLAPIAADHPGFSPETYNRAYTALKTMTR